MNGKKDCGCGKKQGTARPGERPTRFVSLSLTLREYDALVHAALGAGKTVQEWVREVALGAAGGKQ